MSSAEVVRDWLSGALLYTAAILLAGMGWVALSTLLLRADVSTTEVVIGSSGDWNFDQFPASSIASNNMAPNGEGLSPDAWDVVESRSLIACDCPTSDGDSTGCSNDGLILFRAQRDGSCQAGVSHFDGSSFTPPTRLRAPDMDPAHPIRFGGR